MLRQHQSARFAPNCNAVERLLGVAFKTVTQGFTVNRYLLHTLGTTDFIDKINKDIIELNWGQTVNNMSNSLINWNTLLKRQVFSQPCQMISAELLNLYPTFCPGNDGTHH